MRRRYYDRFLFRQSLLVLLIVAFHLLLLGSVFLVVRENRIVTERTGEEQSRTDADRTELAGYEESFAEANRSASRAIAFYRDHPSWTAVLLALDRTIPDSVTVSSLSSKDYLIYLSGSAETRDDFLEFERRLREEPCFSSVEAPVSNLFSKEDVEFQIDLSVDRECLKPNR